jgi:hypothetical protein
MKAHSPGRLRAIRGDSRKRELMMVKSFAAVCLLGLTLTTADAFDLNELAPCKPAAARYCDRSEGMTMSNLIRCGATLAAISNRVGDRCRAVLRRYGQI